MAQAISQDDIQKGVNPDAKREASEQPAVTEGDKLIDTHGAYLDSPRNVAKELGVAFVDMNKITHDLVGHGTGRLPKIIYVGTCQSGCRDAEGT